MSLNDLIAKTIKTFRFANGDDRVVQFLRFSKGKIAPTAVIAEEMI